MLRRDPNKRFSFKEVTAHPIFLYKAAVEK